MGPPVGGRFTVTNIYVQRLIRVAYNVQEFQISSALGWIETERHDIAAKTDQASVTLEQYRLMLQTLLTECFRLSTHRETRAGAGEAIRRRPNQSHRAVPPLRSVMLNPPATTLFPCFGPVRSGLPHAFWYDPSLPESIEATHMMADFLRKNLGS
jgi:Protein of unknown function (DUF3738)